MILFDQFSFSLVNIGNERGEEEEKTIQKNNEVSLCNIQNVTKSEL